MRFRLIALWVGLAALTTTLAWAALSSADRRVGEGPLVSGLTGAAPSHVDATTGETDSGTSASTPVDASPRPSLSSPATTSPTTTATAPTTSTTGISPAPTTSGPEGWTSLTVPSEGGVVVVEHRPSEVRLRSATPAPGYAMEVDRQTFDEVRVEFHSAEEEVEVRVRWHDGALDVEVRGP